MRWLSRIGLIVWLGFLVWGSLMPTVPAGRTIRVVPGGAYTVHAVAYAILCMMAVFALGSTGPRGLLLTALGACLLGLVLEWVQPHTGRAFDWGDVAANAAGVAAGLVAVFCLRRVPGCCRRAEPGG
ncbi:MAG: VanZ family protein [Candidatus Brocadiaceae bacterium]|nr:VanZ family protein [Candidatus Brocadiaceae bacterium]